MSRHSPRRVGCNENMSTQPDGRESRPVPARFARCLAYVTLSILLLTVTAVPQDLKIRLVNAKNGAPLRDRIVVAEVNPRIETRTSADGTAIIRLPTPTPTSILIGLENGSIYACGPGGFSVRRILEDGVVAQHEWCVMETGIAERFAARPGEVVLFARPLHWWERMQR